jgi:hypothetical protein
MRSLSFLLRKMLSEVTPEPQQLNREARPRENQARLHREVICLIAPMRFTGSRQNRF